MRKAINSYKLPTMLIGWWRREILTVINWIHPYKVDRVRRREI